MAASGHMKNEQRATASTGPGPYNIDATADSNMGNEKLNGKQPVDENYVLGEQNGEGATSLEPQGATAPIPKIPEAAGPVSGADSRKNKRVSSPLCAFVLSLVLGWPIFYSWLGFNLKKGVILTEDPQRITAPQRFKDEPFWLTHLILQRIRKPQLTPLCLM